MLLGAIGLISTAGRAQTTFRLSQPTYLCQSGFIRINTAGGDGTTPTFSATGVALASPTSYTGLVETAWRTDPSVGPVSLQAIQSGVVATYSLDVPSYCSASNRFLWPILKAPLPDLTLSQNSDSPLLNVGSYFKSTGSYDYRALFRYEAYGVPPGMVFNSRSGTPPGTVGSDTAFAFISGRPTTPGTYPVVLIATNQGAFTSAYSIADTFNITVKETTLNLPPVVVGRGLTSPQSATAGLVFETQTAYAFADPEGQALTYSSSSLPAGLSINPTTGLIVGTPVNEGRVGVTVAATDGAGSTVYSGFFLNIQLSSAVNVPPQVVGLGLNSPLSATVGVAFSTSTAYAFSDPEKYPLRYLSNSLPAGLQLDLNTGIISGTPVNPGTVGITVGAVDDAGSIVYSGFLLSIQTNPAVNLPPFVLSKGLTSPLSATVGVYFSAPTAYAFADPEGRTLTYSSSSLPAGLSIQPGSGLISGIPINPGTSGVTVAAVDDGNQVVYSGFFLNTSPNPSGRMGTMASEEIPATLQVKVLGNPAFTNQVALEIQGGAGQQITVQSFDSQGRPLGSALLRGTEPVEHTVLTIGQTTGLYLIQVSIPGQRQVVKVLKL